MRGAGLFALLAAAGLLSAAPPKRAAKPKTPPAESAPAQEGRWQKAVSFKGEAEVDGQVLKGQGRLLVYLPFGYEDPARKDQVWPVAVALAGWNHPAEFWRDQSVVARLADKYGIVVACPEMGQTIYETRYFKETTRRWGPVPGLPWLLQAVLPYVRGHYRVKPGPEGAGILGYSTGGRGALVAVQAGAPFAFCGSLSGTYDLPALTPRTGEYKIHAYVYGERSAFPGRWAEESSQDEKRTAPLRKVHLYVAHGLKDKVVDPGQASRWREFMIAQRLPGRVELDPNGGHDWAFWNGRLPELFEEMDQVFRGVAVNRLPEAKPKADPQCWTCHERLEKAGGRSR